jgi:hypothetical protein
VSTRARVIGFAVVVVVLVAAVTAYLLHAREQQQQEAHAPSSLKTTSLAKLESGPRIVFRSNARSRYGVAAVVALRDPHGPRAYTSTPCARLYATADRTLCLYLDRASITYKAKIVETGRTLPLAGIPSRARLSPDGRLAATTAFTNGDSYAGNSFSTRTNISTVEGPPRTVSLEDFTLHHHGHVIKPVDRNYWGVTFAADGDRFYATVAFSGHTWLVRGSVRSRSVTTMREDAECPSLSPDGTHIVYKKRLGHPSGTWRLAVLDLHTGHETLLAEHRSVDDQAEWLDDDHVLYALPGSGGDPRLYDVWSVPTDGSGKPRMTIQLASSPAVVR